MFLEGSAPVLYQDIWDDEILTLLRRCFDDPSVCPTAVAALIKHCDIRGFKGDLTADYLTDLLVSSENTYSLACESGEEPGGSIRTLMLHDMGIFFELFKADFETLFASPSMEAYRCILDYTPTGNHQLYNEEISGRICALAKKLKSATSPEEMRVILTGYYTECGTGMLGLYKAFTISGSGRGDLLITPVVNMLNVKLDDLVGYEIAKKKLTGNTDAFVNRLPANNCLLYGDAGTGKSTCIKALATEYYNRGLRIIQVHRNEFELLNELLDVIRKRNYRFIIYMDDLSFEDHETEYKYLKAVIEGGLEMRPDNVLIYATSNRRHLIRENFSDRDDRDEDMHRSDTMAEKLSLSQRFGMSIFFGAPSKKEYDLIVRELARRAHLTMDEDTLLEEANKWELSHGGRSGRCARQLIDHLCGQDPGRE